MAVADEAIEGAEVDEAVKDGVGVPERVRTLSLEGLLLAVLRLSDLPDCSTPPAEPFDAELMMGLQSSSLSSRPADPDRVLALRAISFFSNSSRLIKSSRRVCRSAICCKRRNKDEVSSLVIHFARSACSRSAICFSEGALSGRRWSDLIREFLSVLFDCTAFSESIRGPDDGLGCLSMTEGVLRGGPLELLRAGESVLSLEAGLGGLQ